jgi:hypothetical protein
MLQDAENRHANDSIYCAQLKKIPKSVCSVSSTISHRTRLLEPGYGTQEKIGMKAEATAKGR